MNKGFRLRALGFGLSVLTASGCAKQAAGTVPDGPPLAMPLPPARVLVPVEEPPPVVAQPVEPEPAAPTVAAPKPAPKPAAAAPKPQPPAPVAAAPAPAPADTRQLQTPGTSVATERTVRDLLSRAARDLGRVNYTRLSTDGRAQYDQSKRFAEQAQEALREKNFVFAETLADKAATLAAELLQ